MFREGKGVFVLVVVLRFTQMSRGFLVLLDEVAVVLHNDSLIDMQEIREVVGDICPLAIYRIRDDSSELHL